MSSNKNKDFEIGRFAYHIRLLLLFIFIVLGTTGIIISSVHVGIWKETPLGFSEKKIASMLKMTSRMADYRQARFRGSGASNETPRLANIKETKIFSERQQEVAKEILITTQKRILLLLMPMFLFFGWGTLVVAQKVIDPLFRFKDLFKKVGDGDLTQRIVLEKHHEGKRTQALVNRAMNEVDGSFSKLKKSASEIQDAEEFRRVVLEELNRFKTSLN